MIKLRGSEGYYSRIIPLGGSSFKIRELEDDDFAAFVDLVRDALRLAGLTGEGLTPDEISPELITQAQAEQALQVTGEEAARVLRAARAPIDFAVARGLVGWDLPQEECTPETAVLLPPWVRVQLCQAILRETQLQPDEQGNS